MLVSRRAAYPQSYRAAGQTPSHEWWTPPAVVRALELEFGPFDLDPCATTVSAKAPRFYTKEEDGLQQDWSGRIFLNPPYGDLAPWLLRARQAAADGNLVVCLLPVRTDTRWWHEHVEGRAEVRFLKGRIRFLRPGLPAESTPFPSAVVIYRPYVRPGELSNNLRRAFNEP